MKILFSGYHNPHFITITEYIERAISKLGHELISFDDRHFVLPGRIRHWVPLLKQWDLARLNRNFIELANTSKPDAIIVSGGHRILPETVIKLKSIGCKTALWTTDPPTQFSYILKAAPFYDHIFCQGSEAVNIFTTNGIHNARLLPMSCDPEIHTRKTLTEEELKQYACDVAFVGSIDPSIYPFRVKALEQLAGFNLGVWGPGSNCIPESSPLKKHIRGDAVNPDVWTKIYSCAKIVLCMHYKDPAGIIPCYQASPRVFETLSCGAFLIVDRQKDVMQMFEDGKHLVYFNGNEDLKRKVSYHLSHPEERNKIAKTGFDFVRENHTYTKRVQELLQSIVRNG